MSWFLIILLRVIDTRIHHFCTMQFVFSTGLLRPRATSNDKHDLRLMCGALCFFLVMKQMVHHSGLVPVRIV